MMWLNSAINIEVQRNAFLPLGITAIDEISGLEIDLTGYSFTLSVAHEAGGDVIATYLGEVVNAPLGQVDFVIDGSDFSSIDGDKEIVRLAYDIKSVYGTEPVIFMRGSVILTPGVTI